MDAQEQIVFNNFSKAVKMLYDAGFTDAQVNEVIYRLDLVARYHDASDSKKHKVVNAIKKFDTPGFFNCPTEEIPLKILMAIKE